MASAHDSGRSARWDDWLDRLKRARLVLAAAAIVFAGLWLAGLLLFRLLYYIIPFALSLAILGVRELVLGMRGTPPPPVATIPSIAPTDIVTPTDAPAEKTEVH